MNSAVLASALNRALILAALTGAVTTLTARQQGQSWEDAVIAGVIIALTAVISRLGIEGAYDQKRAVDGNANAGDVPVASAKLDVQKVG